MNVDEDCNIKETIPNIVINGADFNNSNEIYNKNIDTSDKKGDSSHKSNRCVFNFELIQDNS